MKHRSSLQAINSVAVKEFIHIYRDWRILVLLLILPPVFTLIFGHAFQSTGSKNVPALLEDRDQSAQSDQFVRQLTGGRNLQVENGEENQRSPGFGERTCASGARHSTRLGRELKERRSDRAPALSRWRQHQHGQGTGRPDPGKSRRIPEEAARSDGRRVARRSDRSREKTAGDGAAGVYLRDDPVGNQDADPLQSRPAFHRLRCPRDHRDHPATAHRHPDRLHDRARAGIRDPLSTDGHVASAERNRDRKDSALSGDFDSAHTRHHRRRGLAFSRSVPSAARCWR